MNTKSIFNHFSTFNNLISVVCTNIRIKYYTVISNNISILYKNLSRQIEIRLRTPSKFNDQIKSTKSYKIIKRFKMLVNFILRVKSLWIYYESSIHTTLSCSVFLFVWLTVVMTQLAEKGIQIHDRPIKHMLGLWLGARPADIFWTFYPPPSPPFHPHSCAANSQKNCCAGVELCHRGSPCHVYSD